MSMKTPLGIVRGLGIAHAGTRHWWVQKATSVALVPLTVWFIVSMAAMTGADYDAFVNWIRMPVTSVLLILFLGFVFYHFRIGVQVVIEDYVHRGAKIAALLLNDAFGLAVGLLSILSVLRIVFGG